MGLGRGVFEKPGFDDEAAGVFDGVEVDFLLGDVAGVFGSADIGENVAQGVGECGGKRAGMSEAGVVLPLALARGAGDGGVLEEVHVVGGRFVGLALLGALYLW